MRELDDTDRAILGLLPDDARRSWRDIADAVDLSPPAVSDPVDRLEELGVVRGFTVDVDRSKLREGTPLLVAVEAVPGAAGSVFDALCGADRVEHAFVTADERVVFTAIVEDGAVRDLLADDVDLEAVRSFDVSVLRDRA
jgi:DNA-binding Lrp family transcriptional regulator